MSPRDPRPSRLGIVSRHIEHAIIKVLIVLMSFLLIAATVQLGYEVICAVVASPSFLVGIDGLLGLFGVFLLVLIGIELLDTIKVYEKEHVVHVEVVILVAIIAVARKVIVLDFKTYTGLEILGIAAILLGLAVAYFLIKRAGGCAFWPLPRPPDPTGPPPAAPPAPAAKDD